MIGFVLVYTVVIMVALSFPSPFHGSDKMLGYALILAALWYFGDLLRRLRNGTAGVKPVDDLAGRVTRCSRLSPDGRWSGWPWGSLAGELGVAPGQAGPSRAYYVPVSVDQ